MNRLLKTGLAVVGAAVVAGALRNAFGSGRKYAPWARPPYGEFPNKVLVVGGGFAGYTAAKTLCELTKDRDDVGVLVSPGRITSPSGRWCQGSSAAKSTSRTSRSPCAGAS